MSIRMIQERLRDYHCRSQTEEYQALREITQEIILAGLGRSDFFTRALFQGGTALRIFYGLNRFSEDLDFILHRVDTSFHLSPYLDRIRAECLAFGYQMEIQNRPCAGVIEKAILKDDSLVSELQLRYLGKQGKIASLRIKLEVDTHPPAPSVAETRYLDFPFPSMVAVQDRPTLFAGKLHALLCREWTKGRDWYDFIWYAARQTPVNHPFLSAALDQKGPWQAQGFRTDDDWCRTQLTQKIETLDWIHIREDLRPYIRETEQASLSLWTRDFFLDRLSRLFP
jgi:hypothetical protein